MDPSQDNHAAVSATTRAEELLDRTGQRLAIFALQTRQRLQETISSIRSEADRMDQPSQHNGETRNKATRTDQQASAESSLGTERAEDIIDRWTQRIGATATISSLQVQRFMARMREEVEDIWAEAQEIQGRRGEGVTTPAEHDGERG